MKIRPWHVLLLLLVFGLFWLLLWPDDEGGGAQGSGPKDTATDVAPSETLYASGAPESEAASGTPRLEGSGAQDAAALQDIEIQIVGRGGTPVPAVHVELLDASKGHARLSGAETTDADGGAYFEHVRPGSPAVNVLLPIKGKISPRLVVPIARSPQVITVPWLRRCTYHVVDAETGTPVRTAEVSLYDPFSRALAAPERHGASSPVAWNMADPAGRNVFLARASAPGYVYWDQESWSQDLSDYAERLEVVVPLRPEVDVRLTILDHLGAVSAEAVVSAFTIGGRAIMDPEWERDGFGTVHLHGVPFLRRERLKVIAELPGMIASASVRTYLGTDAAAPVLLEIRLPKPQAEGPFEGPSTNSTIGIGGRTGSAFPSPSGGPLPAQGAVLVRVFRHDGTPAVGAQVSVRGQHAKTNARGVARLEGIFVGTRMVEVTQPGLLPLSSQTITVRAGATTQVTFREARGATLRLEVVDDLGAPLPYAKVTFRQTGWPKVHLDERGGLQRVDGFVDHLGTRSFGRLNPALNAVHVTWGGRRGLAKLDLTSGKSAKARIVLPAPPGAPKH